MKSLINSTNNIRWSRMLTFALSISILLFTQACNPRYTRLSIESTEQSPVNHPLHHNGN